MKINIILQITLSLIFLISCSQKAVSPYEKELVLSTTEETNPYLGDNYQYGDMTELLSDNILKSKKKPKVLYFRTVVELRQTVTEFRYNRDDKVLYLGASGLGIETIKRNEVEPTRRDLEEAGIIRGADIILYIRVDKNNVYVASKAEGRDMKKEARIYANGRVEFVAFFFRKK